MTELSRQRSIRELVTENGHALAETGILIIDHGSRRTESNELLLKVAELFQQTSEFDLVSAAHMELAEPSIKQGFDELVRRGAKLVIAFPYFLAPGRHWNEDIPRLVARAAANHPSIQFCVTAPLGLHPLMMQIITDRIATCLSHGPTGCDVCQGTPSCQVLSVSRP